MRLSTRGLLVVLLMLMLASLSMSTVFAAFGEAPLLGMNAPGVIIPTANEISE